MSETLAGIQYLGIPGSTQECVDAVVMLLQCRVRIISVRILTADKKHSLLLNFGEGDLLLIKSGFSSGYAGTGPRGFSIVLCLLDQHGAEIDEIDVDAETFHRGDISAFTRQDMAAIESAAPVMFPSRWTDYMREQDYEHQHEGKLWSRWCPPVMPFAIIDSRIFDLAKDFWDDPDTSIMRGYRRLEDIVRERTGIEASSKRLFSMAFISDDRRLCWPNCDEGEQSGRGQLFAATVLAFRNRRAHRELRHNEHDSLSEFLQLNQLFLLEKEAVGAPDQTSPKA